MDYPQNITKTVHLDLAVHNLCALNNSSAQNNQFSVHSIKSMHKHRAFKPVFAQKLSAFLPWREIKTVYNQKTIDPFQVHLASNGALTKKERDNIEDAIYGAFDHANKFKSGEITGQKIIEATKSNDADELKRLLNLSLEDGGLMVLRMTQKDKNGKSAIQIAEENKNQQIIEILHGLSK